MNKALRPKWKSKSLFLYWKQRSDAIKRQTSPLYRPCWSLLLDEPDTCQEHDSILLAREDVQGLINNKQPSDQLTLELKITNQKIIDDITVLVSVTIVLAYKHPQSMFDFVDLNLFEVEEQYTLKFEDGEWNVASINEISERLLSLEELISTNYESELKNLFSLFIDENSSEEFLDSYPDIPIYSEVCNSFRKIASRKSNSRSENVAFIEVEYLQPMAINVMVGKSTKTSLPDGVVVCGQPTMGGAHGGLKGHGFTQKLAALNKCGHNSFRVVGKVLGRSFDRNSYFIAGLSHQEAVELIKWTDMGLGLIVESGFASIYATIE